MYIYEVRGILKGDRFKKFFDSKSKAIYYLESLGFSGVDKEFWCTYDRNGYTIIDYGTIRSYEVE